MSERRKTPRRRKTDITSAFLDSVLKNQDAAINTAIEKHVNGGIRGVKKELENYIILDTKWKEEDARWKLAQEENNKDSDPAIKAFKKGSDFLDVFKFLVGLLVIIGGGVIAWATVKTKFLQ